MWLQLRGLHPLRFSSLEFIVKLDYQDQGKTKAEVWSHRNIKSRGSDAEVKTEGGLQ